MTADESARSHRIRVLLMASSMRGGGSEQQTAIVARHLDRHQFDVHLYLTHRVGDLLASLPDDVTVHSPPEDNSNCWLDRLPGGRLKRQAAWLAELIASQKIDVVYDRTFHMTLIAGHPIVERRLGQSLRRVSTIVSPPEVAVPMVEKRFVALKRRRLAAAYARSDSVIAVSAAAADSAARYYALPRERITVIANPVDRAVVRQQAGWDRLKEFADVARDPSVIEIVCVGRMTPEKGQADLLAALQRIAEGGLAGGLPPLHVRLIGDGPDRPRLQTQWESWCGAGGTLGGHRVTFVGNVANAAQAISNADLLVLPSHFEGMPNVVLEAFALRTPVIATHSGGTTELLSFIGSETGLGCAPADPVSLADAIVAACREPQAWKARAIAAEARLAAHHDVGTMIQTLSRHLSPPTANEALFEKGSDPLRARQ